MSKRACLSFVTPPAYIEELEAQVEEIVDEQGSLPFLCHSARLSKHLNVRKHQPEHLLGMGISCKRAHDSLQPVCWVVNLLMSQLLKAVLDFCGRLPLQRQTLVVQQSCDDTCYNSNIVLEGKRELHRPWGGHSNHSSA